MSKFQICPAFTVISTLCWQLSFMGLNRLEDEEEEQQNGQAVDGYLPQDAWHKLARRAESCFRTAPSFHYMWVSLQAGKASFEEFIHGFYQVDCITMKLCPRPIHTPVVPFVRNGAFHVEPPPPKPRIERHLKASTKQVKRIMPTQVNRVPPVAHSCMMWKLIWIFILLLFWFI